MTFAGSIFLIAAGAILRFATHLHVKGLDLRTVGLILMIAGAVGLLVAIWQWATLTRRTRREQVVVDGRGEVDLRYSQSPPDEYRDPRY